MATTTASPALTTQTSPPRIPDGGWGWMVVFSSLLLSLIMDGISFSFGILYVELYDEFRVSSSETAWIGSLFLAVPLLTGPIMSALVDRWGCRSMTIVGGVVAAVGFVWASYARSLFAMYMSFGVVAGLGLGLTYVTAVVSIAFWFDKKRNLAVGLGASGSGIGTFLFAPLTTYLLHEYGWRGTVLILAGVLLNMCVCGALMRDPDWITEQSSSSGGNSKGASNRGSHLGVSTALETRQCDLEELRRVLQSGRNTERILKKLLDAAAISNANDRGEAVELNYNNGNAVSAEYLGRMHQSAIHLPTFVEQNENVPPEAMEQLRNNPYFYRVLLENYPSLLSCRSVSEGGLNSVHGTKIPFHMGQIKEISECKNNADEALLFPINNCSNTKTSPSVTAAIENNAQMVRHLVSRLGRDRRFPRQSLIQRDVILHKNRPSKMSARRLIRSSSCPHMYGVTTAKKGLLSKLETIREKEESDDDEDDDSWLSILKNVFDFSLFLELHFFIMAISTVLLFAWFMTVYFYLADHMELLEYSKDEVSYVVSTIGVTNTLGMIVFGWIGDQPWSSVPKIYSSCLILCGVCSSAIIFAHQHFASLLLASGLYGLFLASNFSFTPVLLVELVPLDRFTVGYGLLLLSMGVGHLGGPPLAGLLYDLTETWNLSFHMAAFWIIISGLLIGIIPYTKNRKIIGSGPVEKDLELSSVQDD